jgi:hypothetical protein
LSTFNFLTLLSVSLLLWNDTFNDFTLITVGTTDDIESFALPCGIIALASGDNVDINLDLILGLLVVGELPIVLVD